MLDVNTLLLEALREDSRRNEAVAAVLEKEDCNAAEYRERAHSLRQLADALEAGRVRLVEVEQ